MFVNRFRLQEAALKAEGDAGGGGGGGGGDWRAPYGAEAAPVLKEFKEPAEFFKAFNDRSTELTTLKAGQKPFDFKSLADPTDEKATKYLARFTDGKTFLKTAIEAQDMIRAGTLAKPLPANATAEQVKEWRAANGIPEKPEGYFEKLPDGLVIGKEDKALFDDIAQALHGENVTPKQFHAIAKWYYGLAEKETTSTAERDKKDMRETTEQLREVWKGDFSSNMARIHSHLDGLGADFKKQLMEATLPDGKRLFNDANFMKWLDQQARDVNPAGAMMPPGIEGNMQSVDTEIKKIEDFMKKDRRAYNKDTKAQERLRALYEVRDRLKKQ